MRLAPVIACFFPLLMPWRAIAHAALTDASPSADSVAKGAPDAVELTFTEAMQPAASTIVVRADGGKRMDHGHVYTVGDQQHLAVGIRSLLPGHYRVDWHATAKDAEKSSGTYGFTVGQ